jgi:hypothetical protein
MRNVSRGAVQRENAAPYGKLRRTVTNDEFDDDYEEPAQRSRKNNGRGGSNILNRIGGGKKKGTSITVNNLNFDISEEDLEVKNSSHPTRFCCGCANLFQGLLVFIRCFFLS